MDSNALYEGRIADCPDCLKLHGIDIQEMEKDGVTKEPLTFGL